MLILRLPTRLLLLLMLSKAAAAGQAVDLFPNAEHDPRRAARVAYELQLSESLFPALTATGWLSKVPLPPPSEITRLPGVEENGEYAAVSSHYLITCRQRLDDAALRRVVDVMETSYTVNQAVGAILPVLRMQHRPKTPKKMHVRLVPTVEEYLKNGGEPGSAGIYRSSRLVYPNGGVSPENQPCTEETLMNDTIFVAFPALGLNPDGSLSSDPVNTQLLMHEGTHQCFIYNNLPIWANEGWAEYISAAPFADGCVDFEKGFALISSRARRSADTGHLDCPFSLGEFFNMSKERMYALGLPSTAAVDTYALSAMIVSFFLHMDGERGLSAMRNYLQARVECRPHEKALEQLTTPYGGMTSLQNTFLKAWQDRHINLKLKQQK